MSDIKKRDTSNDTAVVWFDPVRGYIFRDSEPAPEELTEEARITQLCSELKAAPSEGDKVNFRKAAEWLFTAPVEEIGEAARLAEHNKLKMRLATVETQLACVRSHLSGMHSEYVPSMLIHEALGATFDVGGWKYLDPLFFTNRLQETCARAEKAEREVRNLERSFEKSDKHWWDKLIAKEQELGDALQDLEKLKAVRSKDSPSADRVALDELRKDYDFLLQESYRIKDALEHRATDCFNARCKVKDLEQDLEQELGQKKDRSEGHLRVVSELNKKLADSQYVVRTLNGVHDGDMKSIENLRNQLRSARHERDTYKERACSAENRVEAINDALVGHFEEKQYRFEEHVSERIRLDKAFNLLQRHIRPTESGDDTLLSETEAFLGRGDK